MLDTDKNEAAAGSNNESRSTEGSDSSSEKEIHPGLIDFDEMSKGMDVATARIRRLLHDDTHIYSPTEQFLYKAMEKETGRMTRSRTRNMMDATPPSKLNSSEPKEPRRRTRVIKKKPALDNDTDDDLAESPLSPLIKKEPLQEDDSKDLKLQAIIKEPLSDNGSDDQTLAVILEKSKIDSRRKRGRPRKISEHKSTPKTSHSIRPRGFIRGDFEVEGFEKPRRGRPRKISYSGVSCSDDSKGTYQNGASFVEILEIDTASERVDTSLATQSVSCEDNVVGELGDCEIPCAPDFETPVCANSSSAEDLRAMVNDDKGVSKMSLSPDDSKGRSFSETPRKNNSSCETSNVPNGKLSACAIVRAKGSETEADTPLKKSSSAPSLYSKVASTFEEMPSPSCSLSSPLTPRNTADEHSPPTSSTKKRDKVSLKKQQILNDLEAQKRRQSKRSPPSESVSASSSVVDIVELALSKQQEIENAYSLSRSKPQLQPQRVRTTKRNAASKENVDTPSNMSPVTQSAELEEQRIQRMINSKIVPRRSMVGLLPGPISYKSFQECREEMYREALSMYTPRRLSFDPEEIIFSVRTGDVKRFRRATEHFCALNDRTDYGGMIYSVISKWRDDNGGTLIHVICRNITCTKTHEADDLIVVLAKWVPELLRVQDTVLKTPLHIAVEKGDICRVSTLLQLGSPICWQDKNSISPLEIAYTYGNGNLLKALLNSGATFHELLANEERLHPSRRGHLYKQLVRYSGVLGGIMRGARKRILRNIYEVAVLSPVFIAPCKDGINHVFRFTYSPSADKHLNNTPMQCPILFTYLAVNRPEVGKRGVESVPREKAEPDLVTANANSTFQWSFRCHGPIACFAPTLNGQLVKPLTGNVQLGVHTSELLCDTFVFLCPLKFGVNVLEFRLHESYMNKRMMFAAQVVMMRKTNPNPFSCDDSSSL